MIVINHEYMQRSTLVLFTLHYKATGAACSAEATTKKAKWF